MIFTNQKVKMLKRQHTKILFVVTQSEWGGAQKYIYDIAIRLPKSGFSIGVAAGEGPSKDLFNGLKKNNINTKCLSYLVRQINPIYDFLAFFELYKLFKKTQPDIIHLNSSKAGVLGSIAGRLAKINKIIYTVHGWVFNEPLPSWKKYFYRFAEKITAPLKTNIICISEYDKNVALKHNIAPAKKLITIHNGINLNTLNFYDKETARKLLSQATSYKLQADKLIIGIIANLYKTKGLDYLLKAAAELKDKTFIIIGEGPERKNLETHIKQHNLQKRVFLTGTVPNAHKYLKGFDIFILPSVKEGCPYTI